METSQSSLQDRQKIVIQLPRSEYLQLSQLALQHGLSLEEFIRRRALGLRLPRFIGDVLSRIANTLNAIEQDLQHIKQGRHTSDILDTNASLARNLKQLTTLVKRLQRKTKI